ncbi:MAG: alpha/beta hydrolase [Armatimonadetes bacterium]|nr:alpha/beta hydrolase [Armatimonadota bacterium]
MNRGLTWPARLISGGFALAVLLTPSALTGSERLYLALLPAFALHALARGCGVPRAGWAGIGAGAAVIAALELSGEFRRGEGVCAFLFVGAVALIGGAAWRAWARLWNALLPSGARTGGWQILQAVAFLALLSPYLLATGNVHRPKRANRETPRQHGMTAENVAVCAADGLRLRGWFIACPGSDVAVLLCHGLGANRSELLPVARFLHEEGFHVCLPDLRGHGDSGGHTVSFGRREARDVAAWAAYLAGRPEVRHILGYAFSMGGSALLHAVPDLPRIEGVVVDSTFADFGQVARAHVRTLLGALGPPLVTLAEPFFRLEVGVTTRGIRPAARVAALSPRPLLIIHGTADGLVPHSQSRALFQAAREPKALWLVEGAGHVETFACAGAEYRARVTRFLRGCVRQGGDRGTRAGTAMLQGHPIAPPL